MRKPADSPTFCAVLVNANPDEPTRLARGMRDLTTSAELQPCQLIPGCLSARRLYVRAVQRDV
jgi:hypothetical protein